MTTTSADVDAMVPLQENSSETRGKCKHLMMIIGFLSLLSIAPFALITIGIHFQEQCPIDSFIPTIVIGLGSSCLGVVVVSTALILFVSLVKSPDDSNSTRGRKCRYWTIICIILILMIVLVLSIFIWNGIFLAKRRNIKKRIQFDNPKDSHTYCQPILYYGILSFSIGFMLIASVSCCVIR